MFILTEGMIKREREWCHERTTKTRGISFKNGMHIPSLDRLGV